MLSGTELIKLNQRIDLLEKSDLKDKNIKEVAKELGIEVESDEKSFLIDRISMLDLVVCDSCGEICDTIDEVRYCGYDFTFKDESKNEDGFVLCDSCFEVDKDKLKLIKG